MAGVMGSNINNSHNDSIHNPLLVGYSYLYFCERRHDSQGEILSIEHSDTLTTNKDKDTANNNNSNNSWRIRERVKTAAGLLTLCLHIGVDPPDIVKTSPCARLECWIDPYSMSTQRALDTIGHALKQQYEAWQPRARYKLLLDPAVEAAKKLCCALRRSTRDDRILFHYNGHGVPKPTSSGEIWVFNKSYTQYIPVSLYDLQSWLGSPCIYVYDCSAAGNIVAAFDRFAKQRDAEVERRRQSSNNQPSSVRGSHPSSTANSSASTPTSATQPTIPEYSAPMSDCIQLAACSANEVLPMNPTLPADLFSACLTTPISMALRWFVLQTPMLGVNISPDDVMKPPGSLAERRSPLGEINWIFTAVTDTIAWSVLPPALFKRLFRQDIMVATMFRNFLLADRIMRHYKCTPVSNPTLPPTHQHPMWQAWDLVVDMFVMQMPALLEATANDAPLPYKSSTFFAEQLTAFEVWLKHGQVTKQPPEQLPIILQVLLSQVHRMRALVLLSRFLDLGPWAVNQALSVGIFPYVLKLLQSSAVELRPVLIFIWARMLAVDHECAQDLVKGEGYLYFVNVLSSNQPTPQQQQQQQQVAASLSEHRAMCAFVLSMICRHTDVGRRVCLNAGVMTMCIPHMNDPDYLLRQWCCLCLGQLWRGFPDAKWIAIRDNIHERLLDMLEDTVPEVRAAALYALSMLIGDLDMTEQIIHIEHNITVRALSISEDASPLVRRELVCLLSVVIHRYPEQFQHAATALLEESRHWAVLSNNNTSGVDDKTWRRRRDRTRPSSDSTSTVFNALTLADVSPVTTSTNNDNDNNNNNNNGESTNGNNGNIQDTMYSCVWCTLLVLSVDSYVPVAIYASAVVDYIHDQLYDSGHITATMASIPGSPASGYDIPTTPTSVRSLNLPSYSSYSIHDTSLSNNGINTTSQTHFEKRPSPATQRITSTLKRSASGTISALRNIYNFGYGLTSGTTSNAHHHSLSSTSGTGVTNVTVATPTTPVAAVLAKSSNTRSHSESGARDITNPHSSVNDWFSDMSSSDTATTATTAATTTTTFSNATTRRQLSLNRPWSTLGNSASNTSLNELTSNYRLPSDNIGPMMARIKEEQALTIDQLPLTSKLFDWCCTYFLEPQIRTAENLEPGSKGYTARSWRRTRNEQVLQETVPYHEEAATVPWNKSFGILNEEINAQLLRFHTYAPHLLACDGQHTISVWDWEQRIRLNSFLNSNNAISRITSMNLINEEDLALLLVGSDDGAVRIYRNYDTSHVELVSSWRALIDRVPSSFNSGLVTEWHQNSGTLLVGGDARVVRVWDAEREVCLEDIYTHSDSCVTCLTSDPMSNHIFIAGCGDGVIRVFDRRNPPHESLVISWNEHPAWILDVHQPQNRPHDLVSASMSGDIKLWDVRQTDSILTIDADPNGLTAFASHDHTPVMASSGIHGVNVWDFYGQIIGTPRIHGGVLGQRLIPPTTLSFHPRRPLLAIGGIDRPIYIVGCEIRKPLLAEPLISTVRMIDA